MTEQNKLEGTPIYYVIETSKKVGVSDSMNDIVDILGQQSINEYVKIGVCNGFEEASKIQRAILAQYTIAANVLTPQYELPTVAEECCIFDKPVAENSAAKLVRPLSISV